MRKRVRLIACAGGACLATAVFSDAGMSQPCKPEWSALSEGGPNQLVQTVGVFDDGNGPALYVGGDFTMIGDVAANRIAKWDHHTETWVPLGDGASGSVRAMIVFDDGNGPALYVGGVFPEIIGVPGTARIARWDGQSWSALGSGMSSSVFALAVFDDGDGPALYAAGVFTTAGGVPANRVAKWDGESWSPLSEGMNSSVFALEVFDDGGGPALYAGGVFIMAGGEPAERIAKWDPKTHTWSEVGGGVGQFITESVIALTVFDDGLGGGEALYLGGSFTAAAGVPVSRIVKWDGQSFTQLGTGVSSNINVLRVADDGTGPALYAGGLFASAGGVPGTGGLARWDGTSWSSVGGGANNWVIGMAEFDAPGSGGPALYAGGHFTQVGSVEAVRIARWGCPPDDPGIPGDLDGDGSVGVSDLLILLSEWGPCADCTPGKCPADLDGDCTVGVADLLILLANWG